MNKLKVRNINIENFRSVKNLSIDFNENLNVFVGINGSGKTTILDTLSISLSWLVNRILRQNTSGSHISETDIRNNTLFSSIELVLLSKGIHYNWRLIKSARGTNIPEKSSLNEVSELASVYKDQLENKNELPVIVYYPVNRVVEKASPEIFGKESLYILDVYENALGGKRNYQSFFEWFRIQDDILNEKSMSRSKWIKQKKSWIRNRVRKLLKIMTESLNESDKEFEYLLKRFEKDEMIYEEPSFLFHELSRLIDMVGMRSESHFKYEKIFRDLEFMFHKMGRLSSEFRDDLIGEGGRYEEMIVRLIKDFKYIFREEELDHNIIIFFWEAFIFANLISLWWLSEKSQRSLEQVLRKYKPEIKPPFLYKKGIVEELIPVIKRIIRNEIQQKNSAYRSEGQELKTVKQAIEQFLPEYSSLRVKRIPRPHILINKGNETFNLNQLSDGEKNLITLVGDIARRLAIANPYAKSPLKGEGIIIIDEIDLHLHPSWQRIIVPQLLNVFPNCQFFISTHSPQVLNHIKPENIFLLNNKNNELSYSKAVESYGKNTDRILEDLLGVDARPTELKKRLHEVFKLIQNMELTKAKDLVEVLYNSIGEDPELVKARVLIKRKEAIGK